MHAHVAVMDLYMVTAPVQAWIAGKEIACCHHVPLAYKGACVMQEADIVVPESPGLFTGPCLPLSHPALAPPSSPGDARQYSTCLQHNLLLSLALIPPHHLLLSNVSSPVLTQ